MALTTEHVAILQEAVDAQLVLDAAERCFVAARERYGAAIQELLAEMERVGFQSRVMLWQGYLIDVRDPARPVIYSPPVLE